VLACGVSADPLHYPPETIERKSLIYRSGLGFFCINHVMGCSHGCRYPCHAFMLARRHGRIQSYGEWCRPRIVANALDLLDRELKRKRSLPDCIHLCLSTDPFMVNYPMVTELSLSIIERINRSGISCAVLTKGLLPLDLAERPRFSKQNLYGISLVSLDESFRQHWEPNTAPYVARVAALRQLHDAGCLTRVHIEPYPTPNLSNQSLTSVLEAVSFVDSLYFGGWNYNPRVAEYAGRDAFYRQQSACVRRFCYGRDIRCEF
jgi:DNA repair photolyase